MPDRGPAEPCAQVRLAFSDWRPLHNVDDPLHEDLSAVARVGDCLFLACDETASVERLTRLPDGGFGDHRHLVISEVIDLPAGPDGEMDIEGLCADDGYLWIVGSHSLKRSKPKREKRSCEEALACMAEIEREANRFFLGRIPLADDTPGHCTLARESDGRSAATVKFGRRRSALAHWISGDEHLGPFLSIPSKENGFDVEGLAVRGGRVFLGLRGPVLGGHAVILEFDLVEKRPGRLSARRIDGRRRYRKHLLDTKGLGIRDLRLDGDDLLVLVGPTMALDGSAFVLRWRGALDDTGGVVDPARVETVVELSYDHHSDHPEGIELWPEHGPDALLVVYDSPAEKRVRADDFSVRADVIRPL